MSDNGDIILTDYAIARRDAEDIYSIANAINDVFDTQTDTMGKLFGQNWQSDGSIASRAADIRQFESKYKPLYDKLVATSITIHNATDTYSAADAQASEQANGPVTG